MTAPDRFWPNGDHSMAALIREFDWATTSIGPIETWPERLRAAVDLMLPSDLAMIVLWGPELVQIYNHAYGELLGSRHPACLGQPTQHCWPEFWEFQQPIYTRVLRGETVSFDDIVYPIERGGSTENAWFTISFSPLRDDAGAIAGILAAGVETTERKRIETAQQENEERQAFLLELSDAVRTLADPTDIQAESARVLGQYLQADRSYFGEFDHASDTFVVHRDFVRGNVMSLTGAHPIAAFGPVVEALQANQVFVSVDVETDPRIADADRSTYVDLSLRSFTDVPLVKGGRLVAAMCVTQSTPRNWTDLEISLIQETAERTWAAVERARAEHALRESEEKYRTLFETMGQGYVVGELVRDGAGRAIDYRFLTVNPAFERLTGLSVANAANQLVSGTFPSAVDAWVQRCERVARNGTPESFEDYSATLDRWYDGQVYPAGGDQFITLYEEVTERKRAEQALQESEEKYRTLFETMQQGYSVGELVRDDAGRAVDYRFVTMNPAFERLTGLAVADVIGRLASQIVPESVDRWVALLERVVRTGTHDVFDDYFPSLDRWFEGFVYPTGGDGYAVLYQEITVRKRAEHALRESEVRQAFLLALSDALRPLIDPIEIRTVAQRLLGERLNADRVGYSDIEVVGSDEFAIVHQEFASPGTPSVAGRLPAQQFGSSARTLRAGALLVFDDANTDPTMDARERAAYFSIAVRAAIVVPLVKDGRLVATLAVQQLEPRVWTAIEIELVQEVAERTWSAIERARAEAALRESEERFRMLFESIDEGYAHYQLVLDEDGNPVDAVIHEVNPAYETLMRRPHPQGQRVNEISDGITAEWAATLATVARTGEPQRFERYNPVLDRWFNVYVAPARGQAANQVVLVFSDITERKRASDALRDSQERLRLAIEANRMVAWEWDIAQDRITTSDNFGGIYGLPVLAGATDGFALVHPDDLPAHRAKVERLVAEGGEYLSSFQITRPVDGETAWLEEHAAAIVDDSGTITRLVGVVLDVTERHRSEAALQESEARYRSLFESIDEGYAVYEVLHDDDGRPVDMLIHEVNPAYETLTDRHHPVGKRLRELDAGIQQEWIDLMASVAATGVPQRFERYNPMLDRWFDVYVAPAPNSQPNRIVLVFTEITERKWMTEALLESEERLRQALDAGHMAYWIWEPSTGYVLASQTMETLFGLSVDDRWSERAQGFALLHPDDRARHQALVEAAIADGHGWTSEFRTIRPRDGQTIWLEERAELIAREEPGPARYAGVVWDITARKLADDALRQSEERYRALFDSIEQGFCTIEVIFDETGSGIDYRFLELNPAFARQTGLEDAVGKRARALVPELEEHWYHIYGTVARTRQSARFDAGSDAMGRWFSVYAFPVGEPAGNRVAILFEDITERRLADEALRASESRYRTLVQNLPDYAITLLDPKGVITEWSEGAERMTGYTSDEAVGEHFAMLFSDEAVLAGEPDQELAEASQTGRVERESWLQRKDGERFWGNEIATAIHNDAGQVVGFTKIGRDLTEQREVGAALQASEERFRAIVEAATDYAIFTVDREHRIQDWFPGAESVFGWSAAEAIGQPFAMTFTPDDRALGAPEQELQQAQRAGSAPDVRWHQHADGTQVFIEGVVRARFDLDGTFLGVLKIGRNVTERRLAEQRRIEREEQIRRELRAQVAAATSQLRALSRRLLVVQEEERRYLAQELHDEIGQMLTGLGFTLSAGTAGSQRLAEAQAIVAGLTEQVRRLSMDLRPAALDAFGVLPAVRSHIERYQQQTRVMVELRVEGMDRRFAAPIEITAYRIVQEALTNLARHAETDAATVQLVADDHTLTVSIRDGGVGFDPDNARDGSGLGGMRERVALLGGEFEIDAAPGGGVRITAELPLDNGGGAGEDDAEETGEGA